MQVVCMNDDKCRLRWRETAPPHAGRADRNKEGGKKKSAGETFQIFCWHFGAFAAYGDSVKKSHAIIATVSKNQPYSEEGKRFKSATAPQLYDDSCWYSHFNDPADYCGKATRSRSVVKSGHLLEE